MKAPKAKDDTVFEANAVEIPHYKGVLSDLSDGIHPNAKPVTSEGA